jgi:hypothetical protein
MLPKVATQILHHTSRAAVAAQNQTSHTLWNVFQIHSSSGPSTSGTSPCRPGSGPSYHWAGSEAGPGGTRPNAGSRFQTGYIVNIPRHRNRRCELV